MARKPSVHPTDGELEILRILWDRGPSTLGTICGAVREQREVATTTIATVLKVMLEKQLVTRARQGGAGYVWTAAIDRSRVGQRLIRKLIDRVFDGSARLLVAEMLADESLGENELAELRAMLDDVAQQRKDQPQGGE